MVAKQNAEVRKLNEIAREVRRQAEQLGGQEIEVGEAGFAAGDLVITRVNDPRAEIFNRERWRIAEVDAAERRMTLEGIDQAKGSRSEPTTWRGPTRTQMPRRSNTPTP